MTPRNANVARKPAQESRAGVLRREVVFGAVFMAVRLAVERPAESAMATGKAADTPE